MTTTSAVDGVQGALEMVQRTVIGPVPPACVKVELPEEAFEKVPVPPLTTDQAPVPTPGVLPPREAVVPLAQIVCGPPAVADVGAALTVMTASAVELWAPHRRCA